MGPTVPLPLLRVSVRTIFESFTRLLAYAMAEHSKITTRIHKIVQYLSALHTCETWIKHRRQ